MEIIQISLGLFISQKNPNKYRVLADYLLILFHMFNLLNENDVFISISKDKLIQEGTQGFKKASIKMLHEEEENTEKIPAIRGSDKPSTCATYHEQVLRLF